jgi:hypothetical protein
VSNLDYGLVAACEVEMSSLELAGGDRQVSHKLESPFLAEDIEAGSGIVVEVVQLGAGLDDQCTHLVVEVDQDVTLKVRDFAAGGSLWDMEAAHQAVVGKDTAWHHSAAGQVVE